MERKTDSKTIEEVKKGKFLGITFDNNMDEHIKNMCMQAGNKLYAILFGCIVIVNQPT